jgi:hypothetical protein
MRTLTFVGGLLAAALLSTAVIAQTNPPATAPSATTATTVAKTTHWRSSKLIGVNIYNEKNEKLGDINEILLGPAGKVIGYVIGVGGFLGMGEHDILVEPSKIKFVNEAVRTTATTDKKTTGTAPTNTRPVSNTSGAARSANEQWYPDHGVMNASKDELKQMKEFKYSTYN